MDQAEQVTEILLNIKAVRISVNPPFTWNTGLNTPIYCDNRLIASYPKERKVVVESFIKLIKEKGLEFDIIAGTATAGIPWASFVAYELDKPMVYVRSHPKDYGLVKKVEGRMEKGARVLIIEDLISTGRSSVASLTSCREEYDANVVAILSIFDYEMKKSRKKFQEANITMHSLSNFSTLIQIAEEKKYINAEEKSIAISWSDNPEDWSKEHGGI